MIGVYLRIRDNGTWEQQHRGTDAVRAENLARSWHERGRTDGYNTHQYVVVELAVADVEEMPWKVRKLADLGGRIVARFGMRPGE